MRERCTAGSGSSLPETRCRWLRGKRGSQMIEATLVMPLTVLIMISLIGLMMTFFGNLKEQIQDHETERRETYAKQETDMVRLRDKAEQLIQSENGGNGA